MKLKQKHTQILLGVIVLTIAIAVGGWQYQLVLKREEEKTRAEQAKVGKQITESLLRAANQAKTAMETGNFKAPLPDPLSPIETLSPQAELEQIKAWHKLLPEQQHKLEAQQGQAASQLREGTP